MTTTEKPPCPDDAIRVVLAGDYETRAEAEAFLDAVLLLCDGSSEGFWYRRDPADGAWQVWYECSDGDPAALDVPEAELTSELDLIADDGPGPA